MVRRVLCGWWWWLEGCYENGGGGWKGVVRMGVVVGRVL